VITALKKVVPLDPDQYIVLIGSGGLGLQSIEMLRKGYGHNKIISIDIDDGKLEAAKKAGATYTINSKNEDTIARIHEIAGGPVMEVIDFVGSSETTTLGYNALDKAAKLVIVGIMGGTFAVPTVDMIFKGTTVYGCMRGSLQNLRDVAEFGRNGQMGGLPVRTLAWDEANDALGQLRDGKVTGRLVLLHP
jgi:alcohol dehydrogenase/propanol-preferring alcohol dehydrogenase